MKTFPWKRACRVLVAAVGVVFSGVSAFAADDQVDEFFPQPLTATKTLPPAANNRVVSKYETQPEAKKAAPANNANNGTVYYYTQPENDGLFGDDPWTVSSLLGENPPFTIGGHMQFGFHNNNNGVFNTHPHRFNLHQGWLYAEKVADGSNGWGLGGRIDVMYGVDGANTQAFGNNAGRWDFANGYDFGIYGWAIPQLYAEIANDNLSVKIGHFYTLLGYEVVPATGNFFYSHAYTMNFSEAFTHTGALATYQASDDVTVYSGWTAGWDTGFDQNNGGSNYIGGASVKMNDQLTVTFITTVGDFGAIGDGYSHSFVADYVINDKWEYVLQTDVLHTNQNLDTIGWNNYLFYTINDKMKAGARAEWWKANGVSFYEVTGGVNFKPMANLTIRPELRYQWSPAGGDNNAFGIPNNQGIFGIDAILTY